METMASRFERPAWVRRINAMADGLGADGARRLVPIEPDAMLETALAGGLPRSDFGDSSWQERFRILATAVDRSDMHVVGRLLTKHELARCLEARVALMRNADAAPEAFDTPVESPLIVTGPARSGTTILFELLWLDPGVRAPLAWEALHPASAAPPASRQAWSEPEQELWADIQPEFAAIHELRSDLPVECVTLTAPSFCGSHWPMIAQLDGFEMDVEANYRFHERILQVLQHGAERKSWLLKTPGHLMTLDALFATYPQATILQTHRDPAKTMPSTVSTTAMVQWLRRDAVDLPLMAQMIQGSFTFALNHTVSVRSGESAFAGRFGDVHFQELLADPVDAIRRAYDQVERPFLDEHAERIRAYLADKPQGKFGKHRYAPEDWGFTADALRRDLAPYVEHFGVALEEVG